MRSEAEKNSIKKQLFTVLDVTPKFGKTVGFNHLSWWHTLIDQYPVKKPRTWKRLKDAPNDQIREEILAI